MTLEQLIPLFEKGEHAQLLAVTIDSPQFTRPKSGAALILGSLNFLGRLSEASTLLELWQSQLSNEEMGEALAYAAIAAARKGLYGLSIRKMRCLANVRRQNRSPRLDFFYYQASAFYAWRRQRYSFALVRAELALSAAFAAEFFFGRALATDMIAHLKISLGMVQQGLASLEKAHQYFTSLGHCSHVEVIETALLGYQLETRPSDPNGLANLRGKIAQLSPETNNYSLSYLYLELAHQQCLRGDLDAAKNALDEAGTLIQRFGHRNHQGLLMFRQAYLCFLRGNTAQAKQTLIDLRTIVLRDRDQRLSKRIEGLFQQLSNYMDPSEASLSSAPKNFGEDYFVQKRLQLRIKGERQTLEWAQDPMGDFMDSLHSVQSTHIEKLQSVLRSGLFSFLLPLLDISRGACTLYFELEPQTLFIFDRGQVTQIDAAVTAQMQKFFQLLAEGPKSKAALVEGIWQYNYHPLRHDQLIYGLVYRLRSVLGVREDWIMASDEGYALRSDVQVKFFELLPHLQPRSAPEAAQPLPADLNLRQIKILQHLQQHESVDLKACLEIFPASKVTLSRDLSCLTERGLLDRRGKGRNTCYFLAHSKKQMGATAYDETQSYSPSIHDSSVQRPTRAGSGLLQPD